MAASQPQVFQSITRPQYAALVAKAQASGIAISGDSGEAEGKRGIARVRVKWAYDALKQELNIQCLGCYCVSDAYVEKEITSIVKEVTATA